MKAVQERHYFDRLTDTYCTAKGTEDLRIQDRTILDGKIQDRKIQNGKTQKKKAQKKKTQNRDTEGGNKNPGRRAVAGLILLLAALALLGAARAFPDFATWYSIHIYEVLVGTVGRIAGLFPVSVSEILLYTLCVFLLVFTVRMMVDMARTRRVAEPAARYFSGLLLTAGILFFIYAVACGVNYQRTSFAEETGLAVEGGTVEELKEASRILTEKVNETAVEVPRDENGIMELTCDEAEEAAAAMEKLGEEYECLDGYYPQPKGLLFSWILSVQKLTGIYLPFTVEANYNTAMTDYNIPFTACHELAHLRGFMQEQEANFIGYLAALGSDNVQFQYSGALLGWIYCTNALRQVDYEAYEEIRSGLAKEAAADLAANSRFWQQYDSPVAEVANQVNDTYLKANGQQDGVISYDRMVELILAYNRQQDQ